MLDTSMAAGPLPLFIAPIRTTAEKLSEIFAVVFLFTSKRLWVMQLSLSSDGCAITALGTKNTITAARATFISSPRSAPGGPGTQLGYTLTNGPPGEAAHQWSAKQGQGFLAGALHPSIPGWMGVTFNGPIKPRPICNDLLVGCITNDGVKKRTLHSWLAKPTPVVSPCGIPPVNE